MDTVRTVDDVIDTVRTVDDVLGGSTQEAPTEMVIRSKMHCLKQAKIFNCGFFILKKFINVVKRMVDYGMIFVSILLILKYVVHLLILF